MDDAQASYWISSYDLDNLAEFVLDSAIYSGDHAMEGICASNTLPLIQLQTLSDISRWIMAQFNISWGETGSIREQDQSPFSPDESDLIHERLRKLGYLD